MRLCSRSDCSVRRSLKRAHPAPVKPYSEWLNEDYYIIQLFQAICLDSNPVNADTMIAERGGEIAQIRYYDEMLTRLLAGVYRRGGRWS